MVNNERYRAAGPPDGGDHTYKDKDEEDIFDRADSAPGHSRVGKGLAPSLIVVEDTFSGAVANPRDTCAHVLFIVATGFLPIQRRRDDAFHTAGLALQKLNVSEAPVEGTPRQREQFHLTGAQGQRVGGFQGPDQPVGTVGQDHLEIAQRCGDDAALRLQILEVTPRVGGDKLLIRTPRENGVDVLLVFVHCGIACSACPECFAHGFQIGTVKAFGVLIPEELPCSLNMLPRFPVFMPGEEVDDVLAGFGVFVRI